MDEIAEQLAKVRFFPGSKAEYESMVDYEVKVIDTGEQDVGVEFMYSLGWSCQSSFETKKILVEQGIEAIVNCSPIHDPRPAAVFRRYGLPVAKKE